MRYRMSGVHRVFPALVRPSGGVSGDGEFVATKGSKDGDIPGLQLCCNPRASECVRQV